MVTIASSAGIEESRALSRFEPRSTIIEVAGDLTEPAEVARLLCRCRQAMSVRRQRVIVDLRAVTAADTKLIAALVLMHQIAHVTGSGLVLRLSQCILTWLSVCRLEWLGDAFHHEEREACFPKSHQNLEETWRMNGPSSA